MVMLPMASNCIAAARADGKAARTRLPMRIRKLAAKRFCRPIKNAAVCAASRARLASPAQRYQVGSKKVAQLPPFSTTLVTPDPQDTTSTTLELDELWSFVLKKANRSWIWIALSCKTRQVGPGAG